MALSLRLNIGWIAMRSIARAVGPVTVLFAAAFGLLALLPVSASAQVPLDPHEVYERRCAQCHEPHAHGLAKASLALKNGVVVLKASEAPLELFLDQHPRGLPRAEANAIVKQFGAMLETGFIYQDKCIGCHDRASTLARLRLFEREGVLEGRYTYRDITEFLRNHGRLSPEEVDIILSMFRRQLAPYAPR